MKTAGGMGWLNYRSIAGGNPNPVSYRSQGIAILPHLHELPCCFFAGFGFYHA
jgi:hypothetical protein